MSTSENIEEGVRLLQELGLKEYEARCFVGLTRLDVGTAKNLSKLTSVPHTRVYEAIRVLESKGLVEVQHSSPKRFRAVSLQEAIGTLRDKYDNRMQRLQKTLEAIDCADANDDETTIQQVWSMSGSDAIENRTDELLASATNEIVLILGAESLVTDDLLSTLNAIGNEVDLHIGAFTEYLQERIQSAVPSATTFISDRGLLHDGHPHTDNTTIGRLLLVDRAAILVSTIHPATNEEKAIFGEGFENGLVVIARRLVAQRVLDRHVPHA